MTPREWGMKAIPSGLALVIAVGATLAVTEIERNGPPGPPSLASPPASSSPVPQAGPSPSRPSPGIIPAAPPSRTPHPAATPATGRPVLAASVSGSSTAAGGGRGKAVHAPPGHATSPAPPARTTQPPATTTPPAIPSPSPSESCAVGLRVLVVSACVKIGASQ